MLHRKGMQCIRAVQCCNVLTWPAWECRQGVPQLLKKLKLSHGQVKVESTPRRLAVIVENVQAKQEDAEERVRGPPAKVR